MQRQFFYIDKTRRGRPAMWEQGGGKTSSGHAIVIAGRGGQKLTPVYVRKRGELACGKHALFEIEPGYAVVEVEHRRKDFEIHVYCITAVDTEENKAYVEEVLSFDQGEWVPHQPSGFVAMAVQAAVSKSLRYHCREPYYVEEEEL